MGGEAAAAGFLRFVRHNVTLLELPALGTAIEGHSPWASDFDLHAGPGDVGSATHASKGILFNHSTNAVILSVVVLGSFLQALGAAMRKYYGGDDKNPEYWRNCSWWQGFSVTMAGGCLALLVMPWVPVVVFVPVTTTVQVSANFVFGVYYFQETVVYYQVLGLLAACIGAVCVNLRSTEDADPWALDDFWASWIDVRFLCFNAFWIVLLAISRVSLGGPFHYAFVAGYTSTLTFICTRAVSTGLGDLPRCMMMTEWWGAVVLGLGVFNTTTVHVQQLMLRGQLSLVEALFGASQTLIGCTVAGIYFREESVYDSWHFAFAAMLCVFGLLLLAVPTWIVAGVTPIAADPCVTGRLALTPRGSRDDSALTPAPSPRDSVARSKSAPAFATQAAP